MPMYELIFLGYEFLTGFIPFLIVILLLRRQRSRHASRRQRGFTLLSLLFALYLFGVFYVTGVGTLYDALRTPFTNLAQRVNFIPFSREINQVGYILNIIMLVPFGFLLPMMAPKPRKFLQVLAAGLGLSLLIELSQLLCSRGTDVDDLIMNTLGAGCGYVLFWLWDKITRGKIRVSGFTGGEPLLYLAAIFLGRFFLFHISGLIRLLYGL